MYLQKVTVRQQPTTQYYLKFCHLLAILASKKSQLAIYGQKDRKSCARTDFTFDLDSTLVQIY